MSSGSPHRRQQQQQQQRRGYTSDTAGRGGAGGGSRVVEADRNGRTPSNGASGGEDRAPRHQAPPPPPPPPPPHAGPSPSPPSQPGPSPAAAAAATAASPGSSPSGWPGSNDVKSRRNSGPTSSNAYHPPPHRQHQQQQQQQQQGSSSANANPAPSSSPPYHTTVASTVQNTNSNGNNNNNGGSRSASGGDVGQTDSPSQQQQQQQPDMSLPVLPPPRDVLERPSIALSAAVMQVYQGINNKFYHEKRSHGTLGGVPTYNNGFDDADGHYIHIIGEKIADRYTVKGVLGKGSFGTVLHCCDEKYQEEVAMKIIRTGAYFDAQGRLEMEIVLYLNQLDELQNLVMQLRKAFYWQGHIVLVFELLSYNLFELIKCTHYNGVSLELTRKFTYQLLQVLVQLDNHRPRIIHSDLKPENVVLKDRKRSGIRIIDFGSSCYQHMEQWDMPAPLIPLPGDDDVEDGGKTGAGSGKGGDDHATGSRSSSGSGGSRRRGGADGGTKRVHFQPPPPPTGEARARDRQHPQHKDPSTYQHPSYTVMPKYIQSRFYRSPEVILELGYTTAIDRWSLGCMIVELHTGVPLFPGLNEIEMIGYFTSVLGPLPDEMIAASPKAHLFYIDTRYETPPSAPSGATRATRAADTDGDPPASAAQSRDKQASQQQQQRLAKQKEKGHTSAGKDSAPARKAVAARRASTADPSSHQLHRHTQQQQQQQLEANPARAGGAAEATGSSSGNMSAIDSPPHSPTTGTDAAVTRDSGHRSGEPQQQQQQQQQQQPSRPSPFVLRHTPKPEWKRSLESTLGVTTGGPRGCRKGQPGHDVNAYRTFLDLVQQLLAYDPRKRIACEEALNHPFLAPLRGLERRAAAEAAMFAANNPQHQQQQQ